MATETLILRPCATVYGEGGSFTYYPADTLSTEFHTLVNEEIADDDASYICIPTALNFFMFTIEAPSESYSSIIPTAIRLMFRVKLLESDLNIRVHVVYKYVDDAGQYTTFTDSQYEHAFAAVTGLYEDVCATVDDAYVSSHWDKILVGNYYVHVYVGSTDNNSKTNLSSSVALTQCYLEIDFESDGETSSILIKQDNVWVDLSGTLYQKREGSWVECDASALEDGAKFAVVSV